MGKETDQEEAEKKWEKEEGRRGGRGLGRDYEDQKGRGRKEGRSGEKENRREWQEEAEGSMGGVL